LKSKFISLILSVAVIAGLMLVPAAGVLAAGDCGITAQSNLTRVVYNQTFSVNVTINNSLALPLNAIQVFLSFDNAAVQVNSITTAGTPFTQVVSGPTFNNTAGEISLNAGTPPGTNTTATAPFVMTINMQSLFAAGNTTIAFQNVAPTRQTKVYGEGLGDVLNWSRVVDSTVTVGVPVLSLNMTPWIPVAPNVTYAGGGIAVAYNGSWLVYCTIPNTTAPYDEIVIPYNRTDLLPFNTTWPWDYCLTVAAIDMVPGWGWVSWTGDAGIDLGNITDPETGLLLTLRVMKMNTLSKNLTANFGPKSPKVGVAPASLSFETFEGIAVGDQTLTVTNIGGSTLNWTATDDAGGWLSETPNNGSLTTSFTYGSQNVTVSVADKSAGTYSANITISGSSSVIVPVSLLVKPATAVDSCRDIIASTNSGKPGETTELYAGETFDVYVNFTAPPTSPNNGFNSIGLTDVAPDGWTVTVDPTWVWINGTPDSALKVKATGNKAEIMLDGPYDETTTISLMYRVTVPTTAKPGVNTWEACPNKTKAWLEYYFNDEGPYTNCIGGGGGCDSSVTVTQPGDIVGVTYEVNGAALSDVDVQMSLVGPGYLRSDISSPQYDNKAWVTGTYWLVANKTRWFDLDISNATQLPGKSFTIGLTTPALLAAGKVVNFAGDYGLIPRAPSMSYALKSVNLWKMASLYPAEYRLSEWKVMDVCSAWLNPS